MMNGYNVEDVDDFLDELVIDYEKNYKELAEANEKIDKLTNELEQYKNLEKTLQNTLAGSTQVAEIQGSYAINKCSQCGHHNDNIEIWNNGHAPRCSKCNGLMLSFPVYSHVGVYEKAMTQAKQWMTKAELVLIVGSKGNYSYYLNNLSPSTPIIQINPQVTQFDNIATLNIKDEADNVFKKL